MTESQLIRAERQRKRLATVQARTNVAHQEEQLRTRAEQLSAVAKKLERIVKIRGALIENQITVALQQGGREALRTRAETLLRDFERDPESIIVVDPPLDRFLNPLAAFAAGVDASIAESWAAKVTESVGSLPEALLQTIGSIRRLAPEVRKLRELDAKAKEIASSSPGETPEAVAAALQCIGKLIAQKMELLESLSEIPETVLSFLRRAATSQARLSDLSSEINEWLAAHELLSEFRIILG